MPPLCFNHVMLLLYLPLTILVARMIKAKKQYRILLGSKRITEVSQSKSEVLNRTLPSPMLPPTLVDSPSHNGSQDLELEDLKELLAKDSVNWEPKVEALLP